MITIVFVEPENEENIGLIARVMKNFGFEQLILVNPKCKINLKAFFVSKHASDVIKKARIVKRIFLKNFDYVIGTTAKITTDYNIIRSPLTPEIAAEKISKLKNKNIAILLGREGIGLKNKELEKCDFTITIPTSEYKTLNVSHALAIILYEIFKRDFKGFEKITPASKIEKEVILKKIKNILNNLEFKTNSKKRTQILVWKRVIGKAELTKREAYAILGFLSKIEENLNKKNS
ncbi:MAG: RNA methyltransferase [Candidatus Woesearchaeota archaeon]